MMKSKGFTLVEIIVSVALISIVLLLLFQLMTDMEYDSLTSMFASDNQVNRATIIKRIDKDLMDYGLKSIPSINNITNGKQIKLSFSNGSSKDIIVTSSTLTYDGESYTVSSGGSYDINNIKIVSIPSNSEKLCSYMLNIDTNNDGKCDKQCTYAKDDKILGIATEDIVTLYTTYNRDVVAKGIQPGWSDTQKLTVENKSKKSLIYSLKFTDVVNEFNPNSELTYTVKRDGIVVVPTTASPLTDTYILKEVLIPAHTTYVYAIDYHFIETGHLQNYQLENKFNARIVVETK